MNMTSKRKFWARAVVIALALLLVFPATLLQAQDSAPLTELAQYFPAETYVYASFRTDDATIDTLDAIYQRMLNTAIQASPPGVVPFAPTSLRQIIDQAFTPFSFATDVRPSLGDQIAFGMFDVSSVIPSASSASFPRFAMVAEITDRIAARDSFQQYGAEQWIEIDGWSILQYDVSPDIPSEYTFTALINDSVLVMTTKPDESLFTTPQTTSLSNVTAFTETMNLLTAGDYMGVLYADLHQITGTALVLGSQPPTPKLQQLAEAGSDIAGQYAMGFALLDGRALTLDMVWNVGDAEPLRDLGVTMNPVGSVDAALLSGVPDDAVLVSQIAGGKELFQFLRDIILIGTEFDPATQQPRENPMAYLDSIVQAVTGDDLESILSLITGRGINYFRYTPPAEIDVETFQQQTSAATLIEITDKAQIEALLRKIEPAVRVSGMGVAEDTINGNFALVLRPPATFGGIQPPEILMVVTDQYLIYGTRANIEAFLNNSNGNFQNNADYQAASAYMLDDASVIIYGGRPMFIYLVDTAFYTNIIIQPVFANIVAGLNRDDSATPIPIPTPDMPAIQRQRMVAQQAILSLMHSISFTAGSTPEGDVRARLVILLVE
jgi:hypothetical protein